MYKRQQIDPLWVIFADLDTLAPLQVVVSELWPTKFSGLVALPRAFQKCKIWGWGTPQFWENVDQSSKFDPQYLLPQRVWGTNFDIGRYGAQGPT